MQHYQLGDVPQGATMSPQLQAFYGNRLNSNSLEVDNQAVHQSWIDVVENVKGCVYNNLVIQNAAGVTSSMNVRKNCDGVIPVAQAHESLPFKTIKIKGIDYQVQEKHVGDKIYWLVASSSGLACCEFRTLASNVVVMMNHLFNLKLYTSDDEVLEPDLAAKHFESLCEKLGWKISKDEGSVDESDDEDEIEKIRAFDAGEKISVDINIMAHDDDFTLNLMQGHGEISIGAEHESGSIIQVADFDQAHNSVQANLLAMRAVNYENLPHSTINSNLLSCIPIVSTAAQFDFVRYCLDEGKIFGQTSESYIAKVIVSLGGKSDLWEQMELLNDLNSKSPKIFLDALLAMAVRAHNIYGDYKRDILLSCVKLLLGTQTIDQIFALIDQGIKNDDEKLHESSMYALKFIIDKDMVDHKQIDLMLTWISKGLMSSDEDVNYVAVSCLNMLLLTKDFINAEHTNQILTMYDNIILHCSDEDEGALFYDVGNIIVYKGLIVASQVNVLFQLMNKAMSSGNVGDYLIGSVLFCVNASPIQ